MAQTHHIYPFIQEKGNEGTFVSFYTQREAKYKESAEEVINYKKLSPEKFRLENYLGTFVSPTPSFKKVDGYKAESEIIPPVNWKKEYLTFELLESASFTFSDYMGGGAFYVDYSLDNGETWITLESDEASPVLDAGTKFIAKAEFFKNDFAYCNFCCDVPYNVMGNVMSLYYGDNFRGKIEFEGNVTGFSYLFGDTPIVNAENLILPALKLKDNYYAEMFRGCSNLTTAPELPATTLAYNCYYYMFYGCTSLTTAPELPATTLAECCYQAMFNRCTSLTTAPELPATTLANSCYAMMFSHCTSLTTAPALPATTLVDGCYGNMFDNCISLVTAPELPAKILKDNCYNCMFYGCTNLVTAPTLPATTLAYACYANMFWACAKLNYVKCLATDISAIACTDRWLNGTSENGTFVKATNMTNWTIGIGGIPENWTIENA